MMKITKAAHLRLVRNNGLPVRASRDAPRTADRGLKVGSEFLDMTDTGVFDLTPSDLFDRSLGDAAACGNIVPVPFRGLQARHNELVHRIHGLDDNPGSGFMQPSNGSTLPIRLSGMAGRPPKAAAPTTKVGAIFAENVSALLPVVFPRERNETARIAALSKSTNVGKETIRHAMRGGRSPSLDAVASIAEGLDVTISDLLTKGFGVQRAEHLAAQAARQPSVALPRRRDLTG
jgi:transcriptional regulator with XRE-family HTH domain